eukprot:scaffold1766_cov401-Prasinococcus_capsulatus_cf.AAC.21
MTPLSPCVADCEARKDVWARLIRCASSARRRGRAMKYQKVKQTRRVVRFYRVSFDFREPFRVFVDGSFLHSCIQKRLGVPKDLFAKLLGTDVKVFTSKCVQADLRQKGEEYAGWSRTPLPDASLSWRHSATACGYLPGPRNPSC